MWPHMWGGGGVCSLVMIVGMLLFWAAVVAGVYLLYRVLAQRGGAGAAGPALETPRAILDRRLAAGEISVEEYDVLRGKLGLGG